jgi:hypothetical protein
MRHPQPVTAAAMYGEMEKEQEGIVRRFSFSNPTPSLRCFSLLFPAIRRPQQSQFHPYDQTKTPTQQINRLTRELSLLRAQTASAASNTSASSTSTSTSHLASSNTTTAAAAIEPPPSTSTSAFLLTGGTSTHPTPSRRHRSSSSLSRTSASAALRSLDHATAGSGIAGRDREPSVSSWTAGPRGPTSGAVAATTTAAAAATGQQGGGAGTGDGASTAVMSRRVAEHQRERAELERVKGENEVLRERVRELERRVRRMGGRQEGGSAERGRSSGVGV